MTEPAIEVRDLVKIFPRKDAVRGISFTVPTGTICGLVGPNGSGKTTTIQMFLDLCPPSSGSVRVLGMDPRRDYVSLLRRIGYVPEKHHMYEWMSVRQLLEFAAAVYPRWDWQEFKRINSILQMPEDRRVGDLSRGEMAKLALLIALAHKPDLLILDEPTSGLDPLVRREFLEAIVALLEQGDRTVFFSTHILPDVERVADRVIVLSEGEIVADASLSDLRSLFLRVSFLFEETPAPDRDLPGARRVEKGLREWVALFDSAKEPKIREIARDIGAKDVMIQTMTLEDIFVELVQKKGE